MPARRCCPRPVEPIALQEIEAEVAALGANAIIGLDLDCETVGPERQHAHGHRERNRGHDGLISAPAV